MLVFAAACSLFRGKIPPYPEGIIFPVKDNQGQTFSDKIVGKIFQRENRLYFATTAGTVYCVDAVERKVLWQYQAENNLEQPLYAGEENFYILDSGDFITCLDPAGGFNWRKKLPLAISGGAAEGRNIVSVGTIGGLIALDVKTGAVLWQIETEKAVQSVPLAYTNKIVFGADDHKVYIVNTTGKLIGTFAAEGEVRGSFLVEGQRLYFGSYDYFFYCLDLKNIKKKWRVKTGGILHSYPILDESKIFFISYNNVLYCYNSRNGSLVWWQAVPARSHFVPVIIKDKIVVSSMSSQIKCFDKRTGKDQGDYSAPYEIRSNPVWMAPYLVAAYYDDESNSSRLLYLEKDIKVTLAASKESPQKLNDEIVFTVDASGFFQPQYEFSLTRIAKVRFGLTAFLLIRSKRLSEVVQEKSESNTWTWYPDKKGIYVIDVKVEDQKEKAADLKYFIAEKSNKPQAKK